MRQIALCAVTGTALLPVVLGQASGQIDATGLKAMITGLSYEIKPLNEEAGKEKYEFTVRTGDFDVPMAGEISASRNYVWLTVYLGNAPADTSPKMAEFLKRNQKIQPCHFYITERGALMIGIAMENRALTQTVFKRTATKLAEDVSATSDLWGEAGLAPTSWP